MNSGMLVNIAIPRTMPAEKSIQLPKSCSIPNVDFVKAMMLKEIKMFIGGLKLERKTKVIPISKSAKPNIFTSIFFKPTFYF